ncbi:hypothetical protein ACFY7V_18735 [[Kitasatospora] papulosa]|uniref:Uncharacterized protein n=1 Tax=[Kitasatospora] papulosa TaxID=1464011 RepID=A0ABZ1KGY8_9ACTN|nr:hypothetical protein [Streptomyces sp. NRRL S-325]
MTKFGFGAAWPKPAAVGSCSRIGVKSTSGFGSDASGWIPSSCVECSPNRLMSPVSYGEMRARSSGSIVQPFQQLADDLDDARGVVENNRALREQYDALCRHR